MNDLWFINVRSEEKEHCFPILQNVACSIPYLQTRMSTEVGKKRKAEGEITISLPAHCTVQGFEAILARMSCSDGEFYNQSFTWKMESVASIVDLVKVADFLLLPDLVTDVLKQGNYFFRKLDDVSPLAGLSHPAVQTLVQRLQRPVGKISGMMSKKMIIDMCRNSFGNEALVSATTKVASQWLIAIEHAEDEICELAAVVFKGLNTPTGIPTPCVMALAQELVKHAKLNLQAPVLLDAHGSLFSLARIWGPGPSAHLADQIAKHSTFSLQKALDKIGEPFFDGDNIQKHRAGSEWLAKLLIQVGLRSSNDLIKVVLAIFRDNQWTKFKNNEQSYLTLFDYCFHDRLLTIEELRNLLNHISSGVFHGLVRTSAVFAEAVKRMNEDHHSIIAEIISGGQYRIVSKSLLLALRPESQVKVVAAVMPHLNNLDTESQAWITEAIEGDIF